MRAARSRARARWVSDHLAEATRLASLLAGDAERGRRAAEEALAAALPVLPAPREDSRLADAFLSEVLRRTREAPFGGPAPSVRSGLGALAALPYRRRAAVVLRHYAGLSDDRGAAFLGCSARSFAELAGEGAARLPEEARLDVRDWLETVAASVSSVGASQRSVLQRATRRRRIAAALSPLAVAACVAISMQIAAAWTSVPDEPVDEPEVPTVQDGLELRGADLPFDTDQVEAGTRGLFAITTGRTKGQIWSVDGYRDPYGNLCLQLIVAFDFGSRRCVYDIHGPIRVLVNPDPEHRTTFVYGVLAPEIEALSFAGPDVAVSDVPITRGPSKKKGEERPHGFFGVAIPEYLLPLRSRASGRDLGYEALTARLTGVDANGAVVADLQVLLGRR